MANLPTRVCACGVRYYPIYDEQPYCEIICPAFKAMIRSTFQRVIDAGEVAERSRARTTQGVESMSDNKCPPCPLCGGRAKNVDGGGFGTDRPDLESPERLNLSLYPMRCGECDAPLALAIWFVGEDALAKAKRGEPCEQGGEMLAVTEQEFQSLLVFWE